MPLPPSLRAWLHPVPEIPAWQFYLRILLILLMIAAAYIMADKADPFFYQAF